MAKETKQLYLAIIKNEDSKPVVQNLHTLTNEEADKFNASYNNVMKWLQADYESYSILMYSYKNFVNTVNRVQQETMQPKMPDGREQLTAINADFLSYLSMMRLYLDHWATRISSKNLSEKTIFKAATSEEFDNRFSYRFFSQLRNYAQHRGMPITGLSASRSLNDEKTQVKYTFELYFNKSELLEYKSVWTSKVLPDIQKSDDKIFVMPLAAETMNSLDIIRRKSFAAIKHFIEDDVEFLKELAEYAKGYPSDAFIMDMVMQYDHQKADMHAVKLPLKILDYYDRLVKLATSQ